MDEIQKVIITLDEVREIGSNNLDAISNRLFIKAEEGIKRLKEIISEFEIAKVSSSDLEFKQLLIESIQQIKGTIKTNEDAIIKLKNLKSLDSLN